MAKSTFFSNSAKLLAVCSGLLLGANLLTFLGALGLGEAVASWGSKLSNFSLYAVLIVGFIAFNGEGLGHKRASNRRHKKKTFYLKLLLIFTFLFRYVKGYLEFYVCSKPADTVGGGFGRGLVALLSTCASYGFVFFVVSLWYLMRDSQSKKLMAFEGVAFFSGALYNIFKFFNYFTDKYKFDALGELFNSVFSNSDILSVLCIIQFVLNTVMFCVVAAHYSKVAEKEQKELDSGEKVLVPARNIYSDKKFGIDESEDEFLMESPQ